MRNKTTYLAGGIEKTTDFGTTWRNELTPFLEYINIEVLDPCKLEADKLKGFETNENLPEGINHWHELKNSKDPLMMKRFKKYMSKIIHFDLDIIEEKTDFMIVYWNEATSKGAGTHGEVTLMKHLKRPVYCVATCELPAWIVGCCTEVFSNFDDLKTALINKEV